MTPALKTLLVCLAVAALVGLAAWAPRWGDDAGTITLHGASLTDERHSYTKALVRFAELVEQYYDGPLNLEFVLHANSELGVEKDYFAYMNLGAVVDYAIVAPSHISTFSRLATAMDVPFTFRDAGHFRRAIAADVFAPVARDLYDRADVLILGYGGGEKRHFFGRRPVRTMEELRDFSLRVQGAPIQSRLFAALGAAPTVISSSEIYNAVQTGVIEGAENSASALQQFKWYEVGPEVTLSSTFFIVRPLLFSGKTFRRLPGDLQQAVLRAGREAAAYERHLEMTVDDSLMQVLADAGRVRLHTFEERDALLAIADSVRALFMHEIGADQIHEAIQALEDGG